MTSFVEVKWAYHLVDVDVRGDEVCDMTLCFFDVGRVHDGGGSAWSVEPLVPVYAVSCECGLDAVCGVLTVPEEVSRVVLVREEQWRVFCVKSGFGECVEGIALSGKEPGVPRWVGFEGRVLWCVESVGACVCPCGGPEAGSTHGCM